ncbi:MAG: transporter ATP-binding protein [Deltaproteobacteria bacterium]|nr:transporter ATP-binding protein [Deltaproteobacteria bacterium]
MTPGLLEVEGLCKDFGGLRALDAVDFQIQEGEIFSILGPNGSGKTTLFNVITGFYPATRGKIFFRGEDITNQKPFTIARKGIARTFQLTAVFSRDPVFDNLVIAHRLRVQAALLGTIFGSRRTRGEERQCREKAEEILEFTGLTQDRDRIAGSLTQEAQKRLSIGMALATDPALLLLDEPTGGVNLKEISNLVFLIERIKKKHITVCLIEHKMKVAMELPDRVMVLNYGRKITEGAPREVSRDQRVIEAYLGKSYAA